MARRFQDFVWAAFAVMTGVLVITAGDRLLGVRLEYFLGIRTFSPLWIADLILVPIAGGIAVSFIYGLGGKVLAHFPPLIARLLSYAEITHANGLPTDASLLPLGYWGFIVVVVIEAGAAGGVLGEIMFKKIYGRTPKHLIYRSGKSEQEPASNNPVPGSKK
jgi:hypothetical protein